MKTTKRRNFRPTALLLAATLAIPTLAAAGAASADGQDPHQIRVRVPGRARVVMGPVGRAYLGVQMLDINGELRDFYGAPRDVGLLISQVAEDSPAAAAGLEVGDVLTRIGDEPAESSRHVLRAMARLEPEDTVAVEVVRDGAPLALSATLGHQEESAWLTADVFRFPQDDGSVLVIEGTEEAAREALEEAREKLSEIDFSELTEEAMREAIEAARERMSEFDYEGLQERLAETEARLRELEKKLAERREE